MENLSKLFEEEEFDSSVLDSLLVLSTKDTKYEVNTIKESILRAVANSLLSYISSDKRISQYGGEDYSYERYVSSVINSNEKKMAILQPKLKESFIRLFKSNRVDYALGETGTTMGLYQHIPQFIKLSFNSTMSLPYNFILSVEDSKAFSDEESQQLKEIASIMAPVIKEENDFVKHNYYW
ncbi:hypothetical protein M1494_00360 [Candidatus Parvarchaeota archaeon]|nr:hypothetical protein [Candidatus Parvarchaeota archaeon]